MYKEYDLVRSLVANGAGLEPGDVGTIVHIYPGGDYEVEFPIDFESKTITLREDQLKPFVLTNQQKAILENRLGKIPKNFPEST